MFWVLCWLYKAILIHRVLCYHGFPPPSFQGDWLPMSSDNRTISYRVVSHGLGQVPIMVKVLVKVPEGSNKDYVFEATGSAQTDDDLDIVRGGVIYAYNHNDVFIWTVSKGNDNGNCFSLYFDVPWGTGAQAQAERNVLVQVQVWSASDFYPADFVSEKIVMQNSDYGEIHHNLDELPELLNVVGSANFSGTPYFFDGTGCQQSTAVTQYTQVGGIVFAYNATTTRLWTRQDHTFMSVDGWGHAQNPVHFLTSNVQVYAWRRLPCLSPVLDSDWMTVNQEEQTFYQLNFPTCTSVRQVKVELMAMDGHNTGYIFQGTGMVQSNGASGTRDGAGGAVFGHSEDSVRLWIADTSQTGAHLIFVGESGQTVNTQASNAGQIRVRVWCGNSSGTPVCPKDRQIPGCHSLSQVTTPTTLINLSRNMSRSFPHCARLCCNIPYCTALSRSGDVCNLYGDKQFGDASELDGDETLYRLYNSDNYCS